LLPWSVVQREETTSRSEQPFQLASGELSHDVFDGKGRGTNKRVEGADLNADTRVMLVDDVVTTGGSIREA